MKIGPAGYGNPTRKAQFSLPTGLAQLVEHRSPKPGVGSSSLSSRAKKSIEMKLTLLKDIEESYTELRYKTSWPTKGQLIKSAIIVLIASVILAFIVSLFDQVIDKVMHFIYSLGR